MITQPPVEAAVRREMLRLALHNSGRSVPLQLVAVAYVAYLGVVANRSAVAWGVCGIGIAVALWRLLISRRYADPSALSDAALKRAEFELEGNAALSGLMWVVSTVGIYPYLQGITATVYVSMVLGSITIAVISLSS